MNDGQFRESAGLAFDLPANSAGRLGRQLGVVERSPAVHQAPGWIRFQDDVVAPEGRAVGSVMADLRPGLASRVNPGTEEVPGRELRPGDRIPDLLRSGSDVDLVDLLWSRHRLPPFQLLLEGGQCRR